MKNVSYSALALILYLGFTATATAAEKKADAKATTAKPAADAAAAAKAALLVPNAKSLLATPSAAPPPPLPPPIMQPGVPPQPSKELEQFMKPFEGTWKCDTKFPPNAFGAGSPEIAAKSTVKFKKELGGFWWRGDYEVKKQKDLPMAFQGVIYIGYDPGKKQVLVTSVDNTGMLAIETGQMQDTTLNYSGEGYMLGMKVRVRETMGYHWDLKRKPPKIADGFHQMEIDMGKGFIPMGEDVCKK